jgi:hypothetical protein
MKSKALTLVAATLLVFLAASSSSWGTSSPPSSAATQACEAISEGASGNAVEACAQGFTDASTHATLVASCALGVESVEVLENGHDCLLGFVFAGGVTETAPSPSSQAVSECASVTEGASDGSPAACEQGYEDGVGGHTQDASCDHLGDGAITAVEYVISCEDGWFLGKNEPACIPGTDPNDGAPGITLALDTEADKSCAASS